jgi:protein TonB
VAERNLIHKVPPVYPASAKSAGVQGTVRFVVFISPDGDVENTQLVSGHPLLVAAAREAVMEWKYWPIVLNGKPVGVATEVVINFTLTN